MFDKGVMMKKISLILVISLVLITGCSVKEGFTTFGALQNKIDKYLIKVDVSDATKIEKIIDLPLYGEGSLIGYKNTNKLVYLYAKLIDDVYRNSYEVFYIDDSLTYIVYIATKYGENSNSENSKVLQEKIIEYIVLDGKIAVFNTEDNVLEDLEDTENLVDLIKLLELKLHN